MSKHIILASQSPRRKDLLTKMGVEFTVLPSNFEEHLDESRDIEEVAKELSLGKAEDVAASHPDAYVIGSDTIVGLNGRQLGKAADIEEARAMLLDLCGHETTVTTGVALLNRAKNLQLVDVDTTRVFFKPDSQEVAEFRETYLESGSWKDKAGAYGLQDGAAPLIEKTDGHFDTIVGLPTHLLVGMLQAQGIEARAVEDEAPVPNAAA